MTKLYATRDSAIDGKHFAAGQEIKDVAADQIDLAVAQGFASATKPGDPQPEAKAPRRTTKPAPATSADPLDTDSAAALVAKA